MLPAWGDETIISCDLQRLRIAIDAAREQIEDDWRQRYRIAGFKVPNKISAEEASDEDLNDQARSAIERIKARFRDV